MFELTIDSGSGPRNYTSYLVQGSVEVVDSINVPTILNLVLANNDNAFQVPLRNSYVRLYSRKFDRALATGFITNEPVRQFLGVGANIPAYGFQRYQYQIHVTSDEYLLNIKGVPFIPAFVNRTMGEILSTLANVLAPGFFDTTQGMAAGDVVPYFQYDAEMKWSDIAKEFADAARFRYKAVDKVLYFQAYGDGSLGVQYDETRAQSTFVPQTLETNVLTVPPVNDAIVVGGVEPQNMRDDYVIGDGFTAAFPLRHKIFAGASQELLHEQWTGQAFSADWLVADPLGQFSLQGLLVVLGGSGVLGDSYIQAVNGVELGGQLNLQHGEVAFFDNSTGILGGVYDGSGLAAVNCLMGFDVRPSATVSVTASGAAGLFVQPIVSGVLSGFQVTTRPNLHYFLQTIVQAQRWSRYQATYRTLAGNPLGGTPVSAQADVTFIVYEISPDAPNSPTVNKFTATLTLPAFGIYVPVNSVALNCNISATLIARPPQAKLQVKSLIGPSGTKLPILTPGPELNYMVGFGYGEQVATVADQGDVSVLQFYTDTIPSVGARIRLQSWEAGTAVARVQDPTLIAKEAVVVGDDGLRTAIFAGLKPIPRTSAECELAGTAVIADRGSVQFDGRYQVYDDFWDGSATGYPVPGRFLPVNAPNRAVDHQQFLVRSVTTRVVELYGEKLLFEISFGQDLYLEKLIRRFIDKPEHILSPSDTAKKPNPLPIPLIGVSYVPDLIGARLTQVTGSGVTVDVGVAPVTGIEVRRSDVGWGQSTLNLLGTFTTQTFTLPRTAFDQTFFLRQAKGAITSRFSRAFRVLYPLTPDTPSATVDFSDDLHPIVQVILNGDIRNIRGVEIRDSDNQTVLFQRTFASTSDLRFVLDNTIKKSRFSTLYVYTFNLMWEYSQALVLAVNIPAPPPPVITIGNPFSQAIEVKFDRLARNDIAYTSVQVSPVSGFDVVVLSATGGGQPASITVSLPGISGQFVRARRTDFLGDGAWSVAVPVSSGALLASSAYPTVDVGASGALFAYTSLASSITWTWPAAAPTAVFTLVYPNGARQIIPGSGAAGLVFSGLAAATDYFFYPYVQGPFLPGAAVVILGPFLTTDDAGRRNALIEQQKDGRVPLGNLKGTTATGGGSGGGGGGGSGGGGGCVRADSLVRSERRGIIEAQDIRIGERLASETGWTTVVYVRTELEMCFYCVRIDQDYVYVAPGTRLRVEGLGFTAVENIKVGNRVAIVGGEFAYVRSIDKVLGEGRLVKVVLKCEPDPTYYAGRFSPILLHNVLKF